MTRGTIITTIATFQSRPLISFTTLLLLLLPIVFSSFSTNAITDKHSFFDTPNHNQAWAFAPTPAGNNNNTSSTTQGNNSPSTLPPSTNQQTNQAPVADNKSDVTTVQDTPVNITLSGSDGDKDDTLEFTIASLPSNGILSGFEASSSSPNPATANTIIMYTPNQNFVGRDSFTFKVTDSKGAVSNTAATVSIAVMPKPNSAPTVPASQPIETDEGKSIPVTLTASDADNDDNDTLTFSIVNLPLHGGLTGTAPDLVYTPQQDYSGTDSFTYKANDGKADSSNVGTVTINVRAVNEPPTPNAGTGQTVNEGDTVRLDGSASSDPDDGTIASYSWTQTAGTSITLSDASSATPTFTAPDVGADGETLIFELVVTDSDGAASAPATVDVKVNNIAPVNQAPTANAGPDQRVIEGDIVSLDGSASTDPDGDTLTYAWTTSHNPQVTTSHNPQVTLSDTSSATPTFTVPVTGNHSIYTFELMVTDSNGAASTDSVTVYANPQSSTQSFPTETTTATTTDGGGGNQTATTEPTVSANQSTANLIDIGNNIENSGGRFDEAITYYDRAIAIDPNDVRALRSKGSALNQLGRYDEAITYYDRAIAIDPNDTYSYYGKGNALSGLGRYDEAITYYDQALALSPGDSAIIFDRSQAEKAIAGTK